MTWTPAAGVPNKQMLVLAVEGGEDQELTATGNMPEAKCAFVAKKLELGTVPVGLPHRTEVVVRNTGKCPAVCFVEDLDSEATGITVAPDAVLIDVGETATLVLTVVPPAAQSYNALTLDVNVRGSRLLRLPISGEAIVPDVVFHAPPALPQTVAEGAASPDGLQAAAGPSDLTALDFQDVTMGGSERKVVTLVNKSPIVASLLLDFSDMLDFRAVASEAEVAGLDDYLLSLKLAEAAGGATERIATARSERASTAQSGAGAAEVEEEAEEDPTSIEPTKHGLTMQEARSYAITIGPFKALTLDLDYVPTSASKVSMWLSLPAFFGCLTNAAAIVTAAAS